MLILSRRAGESIEIGDGVVVTICGFRGNQVRVGVKAPATTPIHRTEVAKRIRSQGGATGNLPLDGGAS